MEWQTGLDIDGDGTRGGLSWTTRCLVTVSNSSGGPVPNWQEAAEPIEGSAQAQIPIDRIPTNVRYHAKMHSEYVPMFLTTDLAYRIITLTLHVRDAGRENLQSW